MVNNTSRLIINHIGNVGLEFADMPERNLHIKDVADAFIRLQATGNNGQKWNILSSRGGSLLNLGNFGILDVDDNVSRFVIDNGGRIGIGLDIPETNMHVKVAADVNLRLESAINNGQKWNILSSGGSSILNSSYFGIVEVDANTPRFVINNNGNVGIGVIDAGNFNLALAGHTYWYISTYREAFKRYAIG